MKAKQLIEELKSLVEAGENPEVLVIASETILTKINLLFEEPTNTICIYAY